jgi:hypothetical protein
MSQITPGSTSLPDKPPRKSLARRGVAIAILLVVGYLVLSTVIHVLLALVTIALVIVAIAAAIWAARVLL